MAKVVLNYVAAALTWWMGILNGLVALMGCIRFFILTGASPSYILHRKRWFESSMLGRKMTIRDVTKFGAWHGSTGLDQFR